MAQVPPPATSRSLPAPGHCCGTLPSAGAGGAKVGTSTPRPQPAQPNAHRRIRYACAEWGGAKVEEAEMQMPGGAGEIESVRVKKAAGEGGGESGWEATHQR